MNEAWVEVAIGRRQDRERTSRAERQDRVFVIDTAGHGFTRQCLRDYPESWQLFLTEIGP